MAVTPYLNSFQRMGAFPLDDTSTFTSKSEASEYAADVNGTSYVGQIISVIDTDNETVDVYKISYNRTLKAIGEGGGGGEYTGDLDGGEV